MREGHTSEYEHASPLLGAVSPEPTLPVGLPCSHETAANRGDAHFSAEVWA